MTIDINQSFMTEKALDYAKLSDLAYATWGKNSDNEWIIIKGANDNDEEYQNYKALWQEMYNKDYRFSYFANDPNTGFSATTFDLYGKSILAIRGTEGASDSKDLIADGALAFDKVLPYAQYQSLVDYIISSGLNSATFDVTGHSLGGFLAQVVKSTFPDHVGDVYTYNAPGIKDLRQFNYKGVDAQGNIKLDYVSLINPSQLVSFTWPPSVWAACQTFFANQQSSAMDAGVYNVTGGVWSAPIAGTGTDIGSEVFTACSSHGIQEMIYSLQLGKYYIDPHKPVTFVGSKADEIIDGLSLTGTIITDPIQPLTLMGGYGNDKIYGSDGDDTLYGDMAPEVPTATTGNSGPDAKAGNDHLYGGRGDDTLVGGEGDDVYHIRCGDGNDTIEDTSGVNTIVYTDGNGMSRTLKFFYATSSSSWSTPDGKATISGNTITMEDGQTITLSGGTDLENFGIHKQDKPEDTENFNAIPGEDGKNDTLFDTAGNDKIEGKGGCDIIAVLHGGNDWVLGGADDDDVMVKADLTGNILIEGNAGMDMIAGGGGNDRIFCEDKGEMIDLVEAGETAENLDIWGERANGMGGNDFIYGSQAKDLLLGGTGSDLVVGGSGDDALFGDGDAVFLGPASWSITVDGDVFSITMENGELMDATVGGDDVIYGGNGNDWIAGQGGDDEISAGAGNDYAFGDAGNDSISGGEGNDIIKGDNFIIAAGFHGDDYIDGGAGDDRIWGDSGSDIIDGGAGNDEIYGDDRIVGLADQGDDYIDGGDGNDRIFGQGGNDVLLGGKGEDLIEGDGLDGPGDDYLDGGDDNDTLIGVGGDDIIFGGAGNDIIAGDSDDTPLGDQGDDYMSGGDGNDQIIGYGGNDVAFGGAGNDQIWGELGDDIIGGDEGDDELDGGEGNDGIFGGAGIDQIWGGTGDDVIGGDEGDDTIQADAGNDTISGGDGNDILLGAAGNDTILGDAGDDHLQGDDGNDYLDGGAGDDILTGLDGNDRLYGGDGTDQIWGGDGSDTINGGAGNDAIAAEAGNDILDGGEGIDIIFGGTGNDIINGGSENDQLQGDVGDDHIEGDEGDDIVAGSEGNDWLYGEDGNDQLQGDAGNDYLDGGDGADTMYGLAGDDLYVIDNVSDVFGENPNEGTDTVQSFIDLSLGANMENLTLMGSAAINGQGNELYNVLTGNDAANILEGFAGNDTLDGGGGDDLLSGGAGSDTYVFTSGNDTIQEYDWNSGTATNRVQFGDGILQGDLELSRVGNNLKITIRNTTNSLTINDWFTGSGEKFPIDEFVFDSEAATITAYELTQRIVFRITGTPEYDILEGSNFADAIDGGSGNDQIWGYNGNDTIEGGAGTDIMDGGAGNDTLFGGNHPLGCWTEQTLSKQANGDDIYLFRRGSGHDTILDRDISGDNMDTIALGAGIQPSDVILNRYSDGGMISDHLVLTIKDTRDTVMIRNWFYQTGEWRVERIQFADGTIWDEAYIEQAAIVGEGTYYDDYLTGTVGADVIYGWEGDDSIEGAGGDDILYGGAGNDSLDGGDGSNTMYGGDGNDSLGGFGTNIMYGGRQNDTYGVENTTDVVIEYEGEGIDEVYSSISYTLPANVENLTLCSDGENINGTGNDLDNCIYGDAGNNVLSGGNAGLDFLSGWGGNDTYTVNHAGVTVYEFEGEGPFNGIDTVLSTISFELPDHVENLTLRGANAINGTGNSLNNSMTGNAAANTLTGLDGNDVLNGAAGADTMTGGAGNDTYYVDDVGDVVTELSGEGTDTVRSYISYTLGDNVENLILMGTEAIGGTGNNLNNSITGNAAANTLTGLDGNDVLNGAAGADTMLGGTGNDTYYVDDTGDVVTELADEGTDTVRSYINYTLADNVESLILMGTEAIGGTGNSLNNSMTGNAAANTLTGLDGNDVLNGAAGADTMIGGAGNDTCYMDDVGDVVTELSGEGTDTVRSYINYTLGENVENLVLMGTVAIDGTGNSLNNSMTGNAAANTLTGLDGNDVLNGAAGADTMIGGTGNDTCYVDNAGDVVTELSGEGTDTVRSYISYTLSDNVENLILMGWETTGGTGNSLNNSMTGNAAANILTGLDGNDALNGAAGADTMIGGTGNDTYYVDDTGDVVTELAAEGTDTVRSYISYTLGDNVENLILMGSEAITGTGNGLNNSMTGNAVSNILMGLDGNDILNGAAGADTMIGGTGNDTYYVDDTGDVVTELVGEGTDTVRSYISYTLGDNVENLILTGAEAVTGTGNGLNNNMTGNTAANILTGGMGNDTLSGGNGSDTYIFRRTDGMDTVTETAGLAGDTDVVRMTDGISQSEPVIVKQNNDLYLFIDDNNYMKINSEFAQPNYGIERLEVSDGYYITRSDIENIVNTMSAINNDPGMDVMAKYNAMRVDQTYINTLAQSWHQP